MMTLQDLGVGRIQIRPGTAVGSRFMKAMEVLGAGVTPALAQSEVTLLVTSVFCVVWFISDFCYLAY